MSIEVLLWLAVAVVAAMYRWIGKAVVSQPAFNRPPIFHNHAAVGIAMGAPFVGFAAIVIAGFILTDSGWYYLAAVVLLFFTLAVRPRLT
jgi:hypothetical protein